MLEQVLRSLNNWFEHDRLRGEFTVEGGSIELPDGFLAANQYYRIAGSVFNDGLHRHPDEPLADERFTGTVYALAVPAEVEQLAEDVAAWCGKHRADAENPLQSESFGGYTYTKASGANGGTLGWRDVFRGQLNAWRKL